MFELEEYKYIFFRINFFFFKKFFKIFILFDGK